METIETLSAMLGTAIVVILALAILVGPVVLSAYVMACDALPTPPTNHKQFKNLGKEGERHGEEE